MLTFAPFLIKISASFGVCPTCKLYNYKILTPQKTIKVKMFLGIVSHHTIIPYKDTKCNGKCFPAIPTFTSAPAFISSSAIFSQSDVNLRAAIKRRDFPNFNFQKMDNSINNESDWIICISTILSTCFILNSIGIYSIIEH